MKNNGKHMHPLPAATEDQNTQESQATPTDVNTTAGSGLHDAICSDSCFASKLRPPTSEELNEHRKRSETILLGFGGISSLQVPSHPY